ncbi:MAG TPA: radical SAM protein [Pyrinomonadaceae bacterium]
MYVMPFWSYRSTPDGCVVANRLSGSTAHAPAVIIDLLENLYAGEADRNDSTELIELAKSLNLIFDSVDAAETWYSELEHSWLCEFPAVDQIELTNRCPYSCKMCPRTLEMERSLGDMSLDLFERIIKQLSGRQTYVGLHHFGESLLHPGLAHAVAIASARGLKTGLSCNPPTLRPEISARLLDAGISNMVLSLDSLDAVTYRDIRGPAARIDRADSNLRELVRLRNQGAHETLITLQMISMHCNQAEAESFLEYCREVGVDRGVVIRLGKWDFDDEYMETLGEFTSPGYDGYCKRPWDSLVILWDGRVVPCCHDYDGAVVLGDLREQSLDEIWRSAQVKRFQERNFEYELCQKCAFSRWSRERQRQTEGFRRFHYDRDCGGARKEWRNPESQALFDRQSASEGFDVLID